MLCALQGIKWIKNHEEPNGLVIVQQSQPKYIDKVIHCIENGIPLLFENLPIDIDAGALGAAGGRRAASLTAVLLHRLLAATGAHCACNLA